jgi:trigger factor
MEVQVEAVGPCRMRVSVTVPAERIKSHLEAVYAQASNQVRLKGFRPGKVPRKLLEQKFGPAILADAKQSLLNETFAEAVQQEQLQIIGAPELGEGGAEVPADGPFLYRVEVDVRPALEVGEVKGVEVARGSTEVTAEDLDAALAQIAGTKRKLSVVDEEIAAGDFARVDMVFKHAGNAVHERKAVQVNTQIPVAGTDPEEFAAKLIGRRKGEVVVIPLTFPQGFEKEDLRGQTGEVELTIHEVSKVVTPPLDDALAKLFDFPSLDQMREDLARKLGEDKVRREESRQEQEIIDTLLAEHPFDVPGRMVKDQSQHQLRRIEEEMESQKAPPEEVRAKIEELRSESDAVADKSVKTFFLLEAIAKKEKIFVTESDVEAELRAVAARHQTSYEEAREAYEKQNMMSDLRVGLMERKVRKYLREHARFTDKQA